MDALRFDPVTERQRVTGAVTVTVVDGDHAVIKRPAATGVVRKQQGRIRFAVAIDVTGNQGADDAQGVLGSRAPGGR